MKEFDNMDNIIDSFRNEYFFLSNFYMESFDYDDGLYPSAEHAFQAAKTLDPVEKAKIRNAESPDVAKKLGRRVKIRDDWDDVRIDIMMEILRRKFSNVFLKEKLLKTGNKQLIEGNWWNDRFWGMCKGSGENNLGKLLMKLREELR